LGLSRRHFVLVVLMRNTFLDVLSIVHDRDAGSELPL
jgi:hypothetical protein